MLVQLSPRIIRRYRANRTGRSLARGGDIKFTEFVRYIIDPRSQPLRDFHWTPQTAQCQPCRVHYDFIGHFETLSDDASYVLERIGLAPRYPWRGNRSEDQAQRRRAAYAQIPTDQITRLTQIYRDDFAAFGYNASTD